MVKLKILIVSPVICLALAGCNTLTTPIIAGAYDTIGMSVSGGPQEQGGSFVFGYKGAKFAVVPVENQRGDLIVLEGKNGQRGFSVFAMLGVDAKGGTAPGIGVQQVVAVGPAAETWARRAPVLTANGQLVQPPP